MDMGELYGGLNALDVAFVTRDANGVVTGIREGKEVIPVVLGKTNPLTGGIDLTAGGEVIELGGGTPEQIGFIDYLKVGFAGDSIALSNWGADGGTSLSPLYWASAELYPCDWVSVMNTGVGGTSSSHLISNQIATLEALTIKPDVVIVQSLQNDHIGTYANADTYFDNYRQYSERALVAGVQLVVLCAHPPKSSAPDVASALLYLNRKIEEYCRVTPGNFFCDVFSAWRRTNAADTSGVAWRGTAGGADSFSDDGTHPTGLAARQAAPLIAPVLARYARPVFPRPQVAVAYDNVNFIYNNLLGPNGLMLGTSGQLNGVNNAGVAGNSTGAQDRWYLTDGNGVLATPSIVTGEDGYLYQQITLSGTASADATVQLRYNYIQNVTSGNFSGEAIIETSSLVGVKSIRLAIGGLVPFTLGGGTAGVVPFGTTRLHFRTPTGVLSNSGSTTKSNDIIISVENGQTVSGSVLIGRVGVHRLS